MKVTIVGGGAAGLTAAIVLKGLMAADVRILERAKEDEAPGLGVALLRFALHELKTISPERYTTYANSFVLIDRVMHVFAGQSRSAELATTTRIQPSQYWGVKRSTLLNILKEAAQRADVAIEYGCDVSEHRVRQEAESSDVLIGADGAGSVVRSTYAGEFVPTGGDAKSRYAWLELEGTLDKFIFGYMYLSGKGLIRISAYPHSDQRSSAIVTHSMGLAKYFDDPDMTDRDGSISEKGLKALNDVFSLGLGGRKLSGQSKWRRFRATHCQRAAFGRVALVGDAYTTKHYETGWGTSAAIQESRILAQLLSHTVTKGKSVEEILEVYSSKSAEISKGVVTATAKAMREIDGQSAKFHQLGAAKFLELRTA